MDEITAYLPGLSPVENRELCVRFDGGRLSSDGGVLVLREIEKRLGLAARLEILRQRSYVVFGGHSSGANPWVCDPGPLLLQQ